MRDGSRATPETTAAERLALAVIAAGESIFDLRSLNSLLWLENRGCAWTPRKGLDVAELLEGKQLGGIVAVVEEEGRGLVNGDGAGLRGGVDGVAVMKGAGIEAVRALSVSHGDPQFIELGVPEVHEISWGGKMTKRTRELLILLRFRISLGRYGSNRAFIFNNSIPG